MCQCDETSVSAASLAGKILVRALKAAAMKNQREYLDALEECQDALAAAYHLAFTDFSDAHKELHPEVLGYTIERRLSKNDIPDDYEDGPEAPHKVLCRERAGMPRSPCRPLCEFRRPQRGR